MSTPRLDIVEQSAGRRRRPLGSIAALVIPAVIGLGAVAMVGAPANAAPATGSGAGEVIAWGKDLGMPASATSHMLAVDAGRFHGVGLTDAGSVVAWGDDGLGATDVPAAAQSDVTAVDAGWYGSVALTGSGSVVAWGDDSYGQNDVPAAAQSGVTAIAAGNVHTLALTTGGSVVAWGNDGEGETDVPAAAESGVTAIGAGAGFSLAVTAGGGVVAWGDDEAGQADVPAGLTGVTAVAAGGEHSLALKQDGTVVAWGSNRSGEASVPSGLSNVVAIAASGSSSLALRADGSVVAWGAGAQTALPPEAASGVTRISAAVSGAFAIKAGQQPTFTAFAPPMESQLNAPYSYGFTASGFPAAQYTVAGGALPAGIGLDAATGLLSGTPTETGSFRFKVRASNGYGDDAVTGWLGLTILTTPVFSAQTPPATGKVGSSYSYRFAASGYPAPTFSVASGALPAGLSLNATTGTISGTTGKAGVSTFVVRATNGNGSFADTAPITVTVNPSPQSGKITVTGAPASVAPGAWENTDTIRLFAEQLGQTLSAPLTVGGKTVPAGTRVNVYYLHADPVGSSDTDTPFSGSVWFGDQILAIASTTADLAATNSALGHPSTAYGSSLDAGLEYNDTVTVTGTTAQVSWHVYNTSDAIRIITLAP